MTIFIGPFETASRCLPTLERICDEHGGSILVTCSGISYKLPACVEDLAPVLCLIRRTLGPVSAEIQEGANRKAA